MSFTTNAFLFPARIIGTTVFMFLRFCFCIFGFCVSLDAKAAESVSSSSTGQDNQQANAVVANVEKEPVDPEEAVLAIES